MSSSKLPPIAIRDLSRDCRMLATIRSNVPWPPRSGRIRLCVSRSPSSVILMPFRPRGQPIDDLGRQQQAVGDDVDQHRDAARLARLPQPLGEVIHHRQVQQRLAAEERQHEASGRERVEPLLDPVARPAPPSPATSSRRACCSRRGRPGCSSRTRSCTAASSARSCAAGPGSRAPRGRTLAGRRRSVVAARDDEAVLGQRARSLRARRGRARASVPLERDPAGATSRETISCASVNVFIRNTSSLVLERDTDVEHRRLHT